MFEQGSNGRREPWHKRMGDRFSEPMHLNLISLLIGLFGNYPAKVAFDLVRRRHYAYPVLRATEMAVAQGVGAVTVVEFGVATGAGLLNLCHVAKLSSAATGVRIDVVGFDSGRGLPRPQDYRDHPELFQEGDYPMDFEALQKRLPVNGRLVLGPIGETAPEFIDNLKVDAPVGFAAVDVDYYSSAKDALKLLTDAIYRKIPAADATLSRRHHGRISKPVVRRTAGNRRIQPHPSVAQDRTGSLPQIPAHLQERAVARSNIPAPRARPSRRSGEADRHGRDNCIPPCLPRKLLHKAHVTLKRKLL